MYASAARKFCALPRTMAASRAWVGICTRTDGCILHARHAGACKVGDVGEEDYEVESILDQRGPGRALKYLLKWKGSSFGFSPLNNDESEREHERGP